VGEKGEEEEGKRGRKKRGRGDVENFAKFLISQN
jgi:hypothetical protein